MSKSPAQPNPTETDSPAAAPKEATESSVIAERRRFPRELPKPDVVELDSDSAWLAFQSPRSADQDEPAKDHTAPIAT
jgi:hypothetical protein